MSTATITQHGVDALAYEDEQTAIEILTRGMSSGTARLVRETIQRAVDHGRALDETWTAFRENSKALEAATVPTPGKWQPEDQAYFDLVAEESRLTARIDNLRYLLGAR